MTLKSRLQRLEAARPAASLATVPATAWDTFIWDGPQDDAAMREAERAAESSNRGLIVVAVVDPPQASN